jgi:hypothetical protein
MTSAYFWFIVAVILSSIFGSMMGTIVAHRYLPLAAWYGGW